MTCTAGSHIAHHRSGSAARGAVAAKALSSDATPTSVAAQKIAIIGGAGTVGSALAFTLCSRGLAREIVLIDVNANSLLAHVMDIGQAMSTLSATRVESGTYPDLADAAIVVVACSKPDVGRNDRSADLRENLVLVTDAARYIKKYSPGAVVITVTNPVDVLNFTMWQETGFERSRCIGFSINDSLRFRWAIAAVMNISPMDVNALVIGEHGPNQVPLFSSIRIQAQQHILSADQQRLVTEQVRGWFQRYTALKSGRTTGWTSAVGVTALVERILGDTDELFSTSVVPAGDYGLADLSIGLPVRVGSRGVLSIEHVPLTQDEVVALGQSSEAIKRAIVAARR
jgi:malate/lactate dehydrogenase